MLAGTTASPSAAATQEESTPEPWLPVSRASRPSSPTDSRTRRTRLLPAGLRTGSRGGPHDPGPVEPVVGVAGEPAQAGRTSVSKTTKHDTGLPGSPYSGVPAASPNAWGMPGCMATGSPHVAQFGQDLPGVVAVPHRHPAGGQTAAVGGGQGEPAPQRLRVVAEPPAAEGLGPGGAGLGDQQPGVEL